MDAEMIGVINARMRHAVGWPRCYRNGYVAAELDAAWQKAIDAGWVKLQQATHDEFENLDTGEVASETFYRLEVTPKGLELLGVTPVVQEIERLEAVIDEQRDKINDLSYSVRAWQS